MKPAEVYILKQPEPLKSILLDLQIIIETHFPEAVLLYKWKIPFYTLKNKPLCYFNATKKGYVDLGFYATTEIKKYHEYIVTEKRKAVKSLRYFKQEEIKQKVIISVLSEAYIQKNGTITIN